MENRRLLLFITLTFITLLLWDAWQRDHAPSTPPEPPRAAAEASAGIALPPLQSPLAPAAIAALTGPTVAVTTDTFSLDLSLQGGGISRLALPRYPISLAEPQEPFELLGAAPDTLFVQQGGLTADRDAVDHHAMYTAEHTAYALPSGMDTLEVPLSWSSPSGLRVEKRFVFHRGSYVVEVHYSITNGSGQPWRGRSYEQLQRTRESSRHKLIYTFTGPALSTPAKRYEKFDFGDLQDHPIDVSTKDGWVAILQHYFVAALVPPAGVDYHYYSKILDDDRYLVGYYGPTIELAPGAKASVATTVYAGPKLQHVLEKTAPSLDLTVDFGVFWIIAKPLFLLLETIERATGNWGVAIILLTFSIKLLFYPLSAAGYRSMAKMRRVQPRMLSIRERYGKDRARMNQAMMDLYKEEKINPLGGCFPILIQIPVFISLYWVVLESVELRQAPFLLWINDLSTRDPYFVLPLLMGISMWFQQRLNPAPMDPIQEKVMRLLPFVFTVFFAFFPSGLVLYWVINNVLSIAQQWNITRTIERSAARS